MIPATFAPMILKLIMPKLMDHFMKVFKLDKVLQYVEQPNELDDQVADMRIELKVLKQHIIDLDKDSHPEKPFEDRITALEKKIAK
jgi:hypothetical protein